MTISAGRKIFFLLSIFLVLIAKPLHAEDISYTASINEEIIFDNIFESRLSAIENIKIQIIKKVLEDLVKEQQYLSPEEILQVIANPEKFLKSLEIISEKIGDEFLYLEMKGVVDTTHLTTILRTQDILLKNDIVYEASFLTTQNFKIPHAAIKEVASKKNIQIKEFKKLTITHINEKNLTSEVIDLLRLKFKTSLILIAEVTPSGYSLYYIHTRKNIFFRYDTPTTSNTSVDENIFFDILKYNVIQRIEKKKPEDYIFQIQGLHKPVIRKFFYKHILYNTQLIVSYKPYLLQDKLSAYKVKLVQPVQTFIKDLKQIPGLQFDIVNISNSRLDIILFQSNTQIQYKKIAELTKQDNLLEKLRNKLDNTADVLSWEPQWQENEINANFSEANLLVNNVPTKGILSSIVDRDLFLIPSSNINQSLTIKLLGVNTRDLYPAIFIFDENLEIVHQARYFNTSGFAQIVYEFPTHNSKHHFLMIEDIRKSFLQGASSIGHFEYILQVQ